LHPFSISLEFLDHVGDETLDLAKDISLVSRGKADRGHHAGSQLRERG